MTPQDIAARLLYRDGMMLIIDKPAGLAVHAGAKGGLHLMDLLDGLRFGLPRAPELAHRLDRDTSGCLVLGRHRKALARLGELFAGGGVDKVYWAVVVGNPPADSGTIDKPLKKLERRHGWRMVVDPSGQPSVTDWRVLGRTDRLAWIEARPRTGRTHQIRVHMKELGCPVLGDSYYGADPAPAERLHLHSRRIGLQPLAPSKPAIRVEAPPPEHMLAALRACGWTP